MPDAPWRDRAKYFIGIMCEKSWRDANFSKSGKRIKRHVPYTPPALAQELAKCLDDNDEERAKAIFLGHDCMEILSERD